MSHFCSIVVLCKLPCTVCRPIHVLQGSSGIPNNSALCTHTMTDEGTDGAGLSLLEGGHILSHSSDGTTCSQWSATPELPEIQTQVCFEVPLVHDSILGQSHPFPQPSYLCFVHGGAGHGCLMEHHFSNQTTRRLFFKLPIRHRHTPPP